MKKPETDGSVTNQTVDEIGSGSKFKKVKYGSMSLITIALVIALVIIFNLMASYMVKRSPLKIDLTADKRYELSDESIDFLKNDLDKDIDIVVTCNKDEFDALADSYEDYFKSLGVNMKFPYDVIPVILEKYELYANQGKGKINVKYVDLDKDPSAVKKYSDSYGQEIQSHSIVVASGDRVRVIDRNSVGSMITLDAASQNKEDINDVNVVFAGESMITSEIMNVVDAHPVNVAFAATINDAPIYSTAYTNNQMFGNAVAGLRDKLLTKNGYFCTDIDLAKDDLDVEKYDMIVIPMPSVDFDKDIIEKLNTFLYNDGNYGKQMLYFADSMASDLKNISDFLADWSIELTEDYGLQDDEKSMGSYPTIIQIEQADTEEAGEKISNARYAVAPLSQEVKILTKNNEAIPAQVLKTYDSAYNVNIVTGDKESDKGVKNVAVVSKKEKQIGHNVDNYKIVNSSVMVFGSGYIAADAFVVQTNLYNNAPVLLNAINKMTGKETNTVIIPDKELQRSVIAPTSTQDKRIKAFVIFVIPGIVAIIGIVVLLRRKNR